MNETETSRRVASKLIEIWSGISPVQLGAEDRFIDTIDSFTAVEYVNRIRSRLGVEVSPASLFDNLPTIHAVSQFSAARMSQKTPA